MPFNEQYNSGGAGVPLQSQGFVPEEEELEGAFSIAKKESGMGPEAMPGPMELEDLLGPSIGLNEGDEYSDEAYDDAMADMGGEYGEVMDMDPEAPMMDPGMMEQGSPEVQSDMQDLLATKAQERLAASEAYQLKAAENAYKHKKGF